MAEQEDSGCVVVDLGSRTIRGGLAGEDLPAASFPSSRAPLEPGQVPPRRTIEGGIIKDWEGLEEIWRFLLDEELHVAPKEHGVLCSEVALNPRPARERLVQLMFERFQVPSFYLATQAVLALYGSGCLTGVVLDSGEDTSHTVPVYEGHAVTQAIHRLEVGGALVSEQMARLLSSGNVQGDLLPRGVVDEVKEKLCYVALDFEKEQSAAGSTGPISYTLPDGRAVAVERERFMSPEVMFKPSLAGLTGHGIHDLGYHSILKCDVGYRVGLFQNIFLVGGNTLFPGFKERIKRELDLLSPANLPPKVVAPSERINSVWIGGSVLASMSAFHRMSITKSEFDEVGLHVVHSKCF